MATRDPGSEGRVASAPTWVSRTVARGRQIIGGLASVVLHAGLLAWAISHAPARERPASAPVPVPVERIELVSSPHEPLALRASAGSPDEGAAGSRPARGEAAAARPSSEPAHDEAVPTKPRPEPAASESRPRSRPHVEPERAPTSAVEVPAAETTPATSEDLESEPPSPPAALAPPGRPEVAGPSDGRGTVGASVGAVGADGAPDHSAYGAELVRLVKTEIDVDPVPGLRPRDSIEVVLEVLPSGRLAHRGLGKYDYAQVVRSTLGPVRLRALLRRILRASEGFPPHPSSFPRERYVVGFTVRFHDRHARAHGSTG